MQERREASGIKSRRKIKTLSLSIYCMHVSLKRARNRLPTFIRSPSNTKQRGGKKNGKRQSSEDRTADEEEVKLFKASGEKTVKQKQQLVQR